MSLNLHGSCDGKEIDFWQTPTHITMMIFMKGTEQGDAYSEMRTHKAWRGLNMYIEWARSTNGGILFKTEEDLQESHKFIQDHVRYIRSFVGKSGVKLWWI